MRRPSIHTRRNQMAAILFLVYGLATILPALSQAASDYSAPHPRMTGGPIGAISSPPSRDNPMIQHVAVVIPPQFIPVSIPQQPPAPTGVAQLRKTGTDTAANSEQLSPQEINQMRQVISPGRSTPLEVALVNIAVKGTSLLMYFIVWLLGLCIFRYVFNRWFDEDVYTETWPSVVVVSIMIFCTAWVLVSTVQ